GVPVLLNGRSPVLRGHCQRSHGGLYYDNEEEFVEALRVLREDRALARQLGQQGAVYVQERYRWSQVTQRYVEFLKEMHSCSSRT
ncbi:MAG: glycosyltransferase, partial [Chloroflexi bacterium]|nr:glycosyltransferase [Chloroflexota bacterium]